MFRSLFVLLVMVALFCIAPRAFAAEAVSALPNTPQQEELRNTAVAVEFEGNDTLGSKLSTRIKELLNASNLFALSNKDVSKLRIVITSVPEFPSRPDVGSAYSVVWLFSQSEATLRHFLMQDVGVLTAQDLERVATTIIERTDGLAVRYGYLF